MNKETSGVVLFMQADFQICCSHKMKAGFHAKSLVYLFRFAIINYEDRSTCVNEYRQAQKQFKLWSVKFEQMSQEELQKGTGEQTLSRGARLAGLLVFFFSLL